MSDRPTPETQAAIEFANARNWQAEENEPIKTLVGIIARLERERDQARSKTKELQDFIREHIGQIYLARHDRDEAREQLAAERAMADRLAEYLVRLRDCEWTITLRDRMDAVRSISKEALENHSAARGKEAQQ